MHTKMNMYAILLVLLSTGETFAQNYYNQNAGNTQQNEDSLTDIRWVSLKKVQPQQQTTRDFPVRNMKNPVQNFDTDTAKKVNADIYSAQQQQSVSKQQQYQQQQHMILDQKQNQQQSQQLEQIQHQQVQQTPQANREYIQKMANQLFLTQKHVPLLSDYQKFIINQDPLVRKYVFGNQDKTQQQRAESSQSMSSQYKARSLQLDQQAGKSKISGKTDGPKYAESNDATAQSSKLIYTTSEPPSFFDYKVVPNLTPKFALYRTVQPYAYYNLGGSNGIPLQTIQSLPLKTTNTPVINFGFDSYKAYPFHHDTKTLKHVEDHHEHIGDNYQFVYDVKDDAKGNNFGHKETRDHDKTYGHYYLQLPDGRFETVKYWADKSGFHANVEFKGRAVHPEPHHHHHHHLHHHPHHHYLQI